jgi:hypothetical protein
VLLGGDGSGGGDQAAKPAADQDERGCNGCHTACIGKRAAEGVICSG